MCAARAHHDPGGTMKYTELEPVNVITELGVELYEIAVQHDVEPMIHVGPGMRLGACWTLTPESAERIARALRAAAKVARR